MIVVYHDTGGTHSTAVAAAIHLNRLPMDHVPTVSDIMQVPLFDRLEKRLAGRLIFHGKDEYGNAIYTISTKNGSPLVINAIQTVFDMIERDKGDIYCVDTSTAVNTLMHIGGVSSRGLGLVSLGRPLVAYGTMKAYPRIVDIVKKTKLKVAP